MPSTMESSDLYNIANTGNTGNKIEPYLDSTVSSTRDETSPGLVEHHAGDLLVPVSVGEHYRLVARLYVPHGYG